MERSNVERSNVGKRERARFRGSREEEEEEEQARIVQLHVPEVFCYGHIISTTLGEERKGVPLSELSKLSSLPRRHLLVGSNFDCQHFGQS